MFLRIMVGPNPKKSNAQKLHLLISYDVMLEYICPKNVCHNVLKNENIFMEFVVFIKDCDHMISHVKSLIIIISQMDFV
jgi:hypothetical protein